MVRKKLKINSSVSPHQKYANDKNSLKIFYKIIVSVFTMEPDGELPEFEPRTNPSIQDNCIATVSVQKKLLELDADKAQGPDEILPRLSKEIGHQVSDLLSIEK